MKKNLIGSYQGFTLIEIVVAITISSIIMGGVFVFITRIQEDIILSKQTTRIYTSLTDFIGVMHNFEKLYESNNIIVAGSGRYSVGMLTDPGKTTGVLIGVVEQKDGNLSKLDPIANKDTYGKKILAYQKLTAGQISSILAATGSVYGVTFSDEGLYRELTVTDFSITAYNSNTLLEYKIDVETPFYEKLIGKLRSNVEPRVTTFSFTLDF